MRFAEAQIQILALHRRLEADALDLEVLREAFADALTMLCTRLRERPCNAFTLRVSVARAT